MCDFICSQIRELTSQGTDVMEENKEILEVSHRSTLLYQYTDVNVRFNFVYSKLYYSEGNNTFCSLLNRRSFQYFFINVLSLLLFQTLSFCRDEELEHMHTAIEYDPMEVMT